MDECESGSPFRLDIHGDASRRRRKRRSNVGRVLVLNNLPAQHSHRRNHHQRHQDGARRTSPATAARIMAPPWAEGVERASRGRPPHGADPPAAAAVHPRNVGRNTAGSRHLVYEYPPNEYILRETPDSASAALPPQNTPPLRTPRPTF